MNSHHFTIEISYFEANSNLEADAVKSFSFTNACGPGKRECDLEVHMLAPGSGDITTVVDTHAVPEPGGNPPPEPREEHYVDFSAFTIFPPFSVN